MIISLLFWRCNKAAHRKVQRSYSGVSEVVRIGPISPDLVHKCLFNRLFTEMAKLVSFLHLFSSKFGTLKDSISTILCFRNDGTSLHSKMP